MCEGCWVEYGAPKIRNPKTEEAAKLIAKIYAMPQGCVGGNLHCELDDWNLDDEFFEDPEMQVFRDDIPADQVEVERACYALLKGMTLEERASALAIQDGFF